MRKSKFFIMLGSVISFVSGCGSVPGPDSKYSYENYRETAEVTLGAPNLSNLHNPPFNTSLAYIKVYEAEEACEKRKSIFGEIYKQADPIGEIYVSKADRVKVGGLPVGDVVIQSGLLVNGPAARITCDRYFQLTVRENHTYEIEVQESRPLLTSCMVSIREKDPDGIYSENLNNLKHSLDGGFLGMKRDMSPICQDL